MSTYIDYMNAFFITFISIFGVVLGIRTMKELNEFCKHYKESYRIRISAEEFEKLKDQIAVMVTRQTIEERGEDK